MERFTSFIRKAYEIEGSFYDMSAAVMNKYISIYILGARKDSGEDYEPDTLSTMYRAIAR